MAIRKVKEYFDQFGIADRVQEFAVSSATVELSAQQRLNCLPHFSILQQKGILSLCV